MRMRTEKFCYLFIFSVPWTRLLYDTIYQISQIYATFIPTHVFIHTAFAYVWVSCVCMRVDFFFTLVQEEEEEEEKRRW